MKAFSSSIRLGLDYPLAGPNWHGVNGAYSDEPVADGHLGRCYLKSRDGDAANTIPAARSATTSARPRMAECYFATDRTPHSLHNTSSTQIGLSAAVAAIVPMGSMERQ